MAAGDLTTLAAVEAWLGLAPGNADEALLASLITAASGFVQTWCDRQFASQSYTESWDGKGARRMPFPHSPVSAVASVTIDGQAIPASTDNGVASPGFFFAPKMLMLSGYRFTQGFGNVQVAYTAGFATIPADVAQAAIDLIALRYREKDRVGKSSESVGGQQTNAFTIRDMPPQVATILAKYQRVVPA